MKPILIAIMMLSTCTFVNAQKKDTSKYTQIYISTEQDPEFPGGPDAFYKFLKKYIQYPDKAFKSAIQGDVFLTFTLGQGGTTSDVTILKGVSPEIDSEVVRVVRRSPGWWPGHRNGTAITVQYTMQVDFKLPDSVQPDSLKMATIVEQMPTFPGGARGFADYLNSNFKYPDEAKKNHIQGKVFLNFTVETDGSLSNLKVLRGIGGGCDEEALRLLKNSPRWVPGISYGQRVRVPYTLPISFKL